MDLLFKLFPSLIFTACIRESFSFPIRHEVFLTYLGELLGEGSAMDVRI